MTRVVCVGLKELVVPFGHARQDILYMLCGEKQKTKNKIEINKKDSNVMQIHTPKKQCQHQSS